MAAYNLQGMFSRYHHAIFPMMVIGLVLCVVCRHLSEMARVVALCSWTSVLPAQSMSMVKRAVLNVFFSFMGSEEEPALQIIVWQVCQRFISMEVFMLFSRLLETDGFNQLAKTRNGYCIYNQHDVYIGQAIEKYGEFCALEMRLLAQLCQPGDTVIEIGANIGAHTIEIARRVGPEGWVIAFEPQRIVFQALCANVAINSLFNVDCYWAAMGRGRGFINVPELDPDVSNNFGGLSLLDGIPGRPVECFPLDQFISLPRLHLVKIDVEGMESEVISSGTKLIEKFKPFLYVENDHPEKSEDLIRLIDSLGYRMYWHLPPLFNPDNYYENPENVYSRLVSFNMICMHRDHLMELNGFSEIKDFSFHPSTLRQPAQ
jgi:FkbM family methyltransferase